MLKVLLDIFSTVIQIYVIAISLLQFVETSKNSCKFTFSLKMEPMNDILGASVSCLVIAFLTMHLTVAIYYPKSQEEIIDVECHPITKFFVTLFIAVSSLFYVGMYGFVGGLALIVSGILRFIYELHVKKDKIICENEEIIELEAI